MLKPSLFSQEQHLNLCRFHFDQDPISRRCPVFSGELYGEKKCPAEKTTVPAAEAKSGTRNKTDCPYTLPEQSQVELELRLLEALEIYPPARLQGIHRHFVPYGLMEFMRRSFDRPFSPDEVLQLLDRFYNLEMLKPDEEEMEILNQEEDFCLPPSFFVKEDL